MRTSKAFADWVKRKREEAELTQEQLAQRSGCGKAYISKFETNGSHPTLELLAKLARALGVPITEPLMALGYLKPETATTEPRVLRLLHYYRSLPEREQRLAEEIVKTLWRETVPKAQPAETSKKKRA